MRFPCGCARLLLTLLPLLLAVPPDASWGNEGAFQRLSGYYLALKAFLDTQQLPASRQFEARLNTLFDLTEMYPAQLRQMEKAEYLDIKRRERENQIRLHQKIGLAGSRSNGS